MTTHPNRPPLLVVDDEPDVLQTVSDLFRHEFRVVGFSSAPAALDELGRTEFPVVLSDQRMPRMSGVEFLRKVAEIQPDATRLLFTGYTDIRAVIDAINEGKIFRYISKPWDENELAATVRQAFEENRLRVENRELVAKLKRSNQELKEANRLKDAFIEVASHELNTPVAVVLGLVDLWKMSLSKEATSTERAWVEKIQRAGTRLAGTVERMLKLLNARRFERKLERKPVEIEPLIREAIADLEIFLGARGLQVRLEVEPGLGSAWIDREKMGDVLANLLGNAIKFTPDGGTIEIRASEKEPDSIMIQIRDSGVGIEPAEQEHLFELFFTGYDTLHHSSGEYQYCKRGMGLGLCLVKSFVEMHEGQVYCTSAPERGSTFTVILPRQPRSMKTSRARAKP